MNNTGTFSQIMIELFEAQMGAYTQFTDAEIKNKTFNVKAVMRELLIDKLGREHFPKSQDGNDSKTHFNVCPKTKVYGSNVLDIKCKFAKPNPEIDEMSIYFTAEIIKTFEISEGDYWYIYFKEGEVTPYIGFFSKTLWVELFDPDLEVEKKQKEIEYKIPVEGMNLWRGKPITQIPPEEGKITISDSMTPSEAGKKGKRQKQRGNRGEEIALRIERERLLALGREDLIKRIVHVAKLKDGLGYDIISTDVNDAGEEFKIYIEVKATVGDESTPFYVSERERMVSKELGNAYYIYRIYNMSDDGKEAAYYSINGDVEKNYILRALSYMAYKK
ncbi:hypothetical protein M2145_001038 [Lachnospiraceae bacterium PF1-21]|uniref:DUF3883 domain-containing protein n=1 Tax=Ohessyouella blattaphilus TaxID=2949333 RepID=UPI003E25921E